MQKFCTWETGYKIPKIDCIKLWCKNSVSGKWILNTQCLRHQATMQKFCFSETGYKIPKIDCIKLRCKNSAPGKLNTKYLKSTPSSYSLSQNCWYTFVTSHPANIVRTIWWLNRNKLHWEGKGMHKKGKNSVCFKCPNYSCIFVWDCRFITWMTLRRKKKKGRKTRFLKFNIHKRPGLLLTFRITG